MNPDVITPAATPVIRSAAHPPLEAITRPMLTTAEAAYYLNRRQQTLRAWACSEAGPVRPRRLNGRLGWPTNEVRAAVGMQ